MITQRLEHTVFHHICKAIDKFNWTLSMEKDLLLDPQAYERVQNQMASNVGNLRMTPI